MKEFHINTFAPRKPHAAQQQVLDALDKGQRFVMIRAGRKWAKTSLMISWLFEKAFETGLVCTYIAPSRKQAKDIVWTDHIQRMVNELKRNKIPYKPNETELSITLPNGGKVQLHGVENKDALRGISNWGAVAMDEYDDWEEDIYPTIIRPNLITHSAPVIIAGCITRDSYIIGSEGLEQIGEVSDGYCEEDKDLYGLGGWHKAVQRFGNGLSRTVKIVSKHGFELEGTPNHKIWTPFGWRRLDELKLGDSVSIQHSQNVFGKDTLSDDEAYLLGLFVAEGSWEEKRVTITNPEVGEFLIRMGFNKQKDGIHFRSTKWTKFFEKYVSKTKAPYKFLLPSVFRLDEKSIKTMLSGYFDGDGFSDSKKTRIGSTSSSKQLSKQIQLLLLNLGILAKMSAVTTPPTKKVSVSSVGYRLVLEGHDCYLFFKNIGFRIKRKQDNFEHCVNNGADTRKTKIDWNSYENTHEVQNTGGIDKRKNTVTMDRARDLLDEELFIHDYIISISDGEANTYDFVIPDTHSYFSNGFVSHNTPKGFRNLYKIEKNPDFKCFHFRTHDNPDIKPEELKSIEREYTDMGMGYYRQEILAVYEKPYGIVYEEWPLENFVSCPYDPALPLYMSFDFGVNDPTAIVWVQRLGGEYRVIDYYESSDADVGHFSQVIKSKPYKTPELVCGDPAGKARSITTNTSPIEEYRKLGIYIRVKDGVKIPEQIRTTHKYIKSLYVDVMQERFRELILNYRYPKKSEALINQSNEIPVHDQFSHGMRALEYLFVNLDVYTPPQISYKSIPKFEPGDSTIGV